MRFVDPTGLKVTIVFILSTGKIVATDHDTHEVIEIPAGCAFSGDATHSAIPVGQYEILDHGKRITNGWFRLDADDGNLRNDKKDSGTGKGRGEFRLHYGVVSHGCITVAVANKNCFALYKKLEVMLANTKNDMVDDRLGFWNKTLGAKVIRFGYLHVIP